MKSKKITIKGIIKWIHKYKCLTLQSIFRVVINLLKEICQKNLNGEIKKLKKDFKKKSLKDQ